LRTNASWKNKQQPLLVHQNPSKSITFLRTYKQPPLRAHQNPEGAQLLPVHTKPGKGVAFPKTHKPQSLILDFKNFPWTHLDSTPFDDYIDRSLLPRVSTRPFDYKPPPNSPHMGINLPRPRSATRSGVPQYEQQFVFVP